MEAARLRAEYIAYTTSTKKWKEDRENIKQMVESYRVLINEERSKNDGKVFGLDVHRKVGKKVMDKKIILRQNGHVSGVEVGDEFFWRGELVVAQLHNDYDKGIDWVKSSADEPVALCVVDSSSDRNRQGRDADTLLYCGEGSGEQEMKGGNMGLYNCKRMNLPVRVVRKVEDKDQGNDFNYKFVYAGLYDVTNIHKEDNKYQFELKRVGGQPPIDWQKYRRL